MLAELRHQPPRFHRLSHRSYTENGIFKKCLSVPAVCKEIPAIRLQEGSFRHPTLRLLGFGMEAEVCCVFRSLFHSPAGQTQGQARCVPAAKRGFSVVAHPKFPAGSGCLQPRPDRGQRSRRCCPGKEREKERKELPGFSRRRAGTGGRHTKFCKRERGGA